MVERHRESTSAVPLVANARMYAVTPAVETAWRTLIANVADDAGVAVHYVPYPAPQPLEGLWTRPDLGCVLMCGFPIAMAMADVAPIAAPIPDAEWAMGRAVYRSDLIVRADNPARSLADTFDGTLGWTVEHSHSGFNALRNHLLARRTADKPVLFAKTAGPLVTARRVLDSVLDGSITIGPLDAYWHLLIRQHEPALLSGIRVLESTALAPMPAFVATRNGPHRDRLAAAFAQASMRPWFATLATPLRLRGFAAVTAADYATTLAWAREAKAAGYPMPA